MRVKFFCIVAVIVSCCVLFELSVRVVLAHPFRALTTFAVCFSILIFYRGHPAVFINFNKWYSFLSFAPGQTELKWVQNGPA